MSNRRNKRFENAFRILWNHRLKAPFRSVSRIATGSIAIPILASGMVFGQSAPISSQEEFVYWPRLDFVIPFQIEANGNVPSEVQLEVSTDFGRSWKVCSRNDVRSKQFQYVADRDGPYVFRLKTVDGEGKVFSNPGPPLKILVDTQKPKASLRVDMDPRGTMQAEFLIADVALDQSSVQLEYQTDLNQNWNKIPFGIEESTTVGEWSGAGRWTIPPLARQLVVRLVAKDRAGNVVEVTRLPQLPRTANARDLRLASKPIGSGTKSLIYQGPEVGTPGAPSINRDSSELSSLGDDRIQSNRYDSGQGSPSQNRFSPFDSKPLFPGNRSTQNGDALHNYSERDQNNISTKDPIDTGSGLRIGPGDSRPVKTLTDAEIEATRNRIQSHGRSESINGSETAKDDGFFREESTRSNRTNSLAEIPYPNGGSSSYDSESFRSGNNSRGNAEQDGLPRVASRQDAAPPVRMNIPAGSADLLGYAKSGEFDSKHGASVTDCRGRPLLPLYADSKTFSLDYQIERDPGAPIIEVELWGTDDGGATWTMWGRDPDRKSPFDIQVEEEGLFGFRMVIVGANGLASNRPRNGDDADSWILVDTSKPFVKLTSALYGNGNETGSLVLEYTAKDAFLADRPVSLFYSESPTGNWIPISKGIQNSGRYVWPSDPNLPPTIFLKIEALDRAGNIGSYVLDVPIDVQGIAPRGRIQGFRTR